MFSSFYSQKAYFCWEQGATILSLLVAGLVMIGPDRAVQRVAGHRPRRGQRGAVNQAAPAAMVFTIFVAICWAVASFVSRAPIPWFGLGMWVALYVGALALNQERENVLWTTKGMILGYALVAVLLLVIQRPIGSGWAQLMGVEPDGLAGLALVKRSFGPWAVLFAWVLYPGGFISLLGQRLVANRSRLVSPLASARDTIVALRTRGEH